MEDEDKDVFLRAAYVRGFHKKKVQ